jgi:beta-lactamase regulating signal transducer with metallopeptidase domain
MFGYFLRTTAVLALALLAAEAAKRRPAAIRHFVLSSALVGLLLLPLLTLVPFGWRTTLLPASPAAASQPARDPGRPMASVPSYGWLRSAEASASANGGGTAASGPTAAVVSPAEAPEATRASEPTPLSTGAARSDGGDGLSGAPARTGRSSLAAAIDLGVAVLWPAGALILLLRLAVGLGGARRLTSEGTALAGPGWHVLLERFLALVSLRRPVRLKTHPEIVMPLTWGWRRPVVLFPDGADGWSEDERSSALFHELSHIKRADFLVMLLVRTSLALFWWNPLCWIAYRELLKAQELACDELVLRAGIKPSAYAASLLAFRRTAGFRWNPSAALLGLLGRSSFQERLSSILKHKIVLMEVKMKTKIMLAAALVAAVSLVGMARPAAAPEVKEPVTVLAETALPPAVSLDAVLQGTAVASTQAEKTAAQEKAKEQEKAKAAEKAKKAEAAAKGQAAVEKTIVITPKGAEGGPIEIVITEGDVVKKLKLDKPLTITKTEGGHVLVLTVEGQDPIHLEGEPLHLEIKGGEVKILKEGKAWSIDEGLHLKIAKEIGEEGKTVLYYGEGNPKIVEGRAVKVVKEGEAGQTWTIKEGEKGEAVWVTSVSGKPEKGVQVVEVVKEGEPAKEGVHVVVKAKPESGWTIKEGDKEAVWFAGKPGEMSKAFAFSSARDEEFLQKVRALQEQVQAIKAKKMDLSALEESLKKLEAELQAKEEKLRSFEYKFDHEPGTFVVKKSGAEEAEGKSFVWVSSKDGEDKTAKAKVMVAAGDKEPGAIAMVFTGHEGEAGKAVFERSIAALKKALPEGYTIAEQKFDAEDGTIRFKVAAPEGKKVDKELVKKLVDAVKTAIDKK